LANSGFLYTEDFIVDNRDAPLNVTELNAQRYILFSSDPTMSQLPVRREPYNKTKTVVNEASSEPGTNRNLAMGQLLDRHNSNLFLLTLNMTVRGDPWYLSSNYVQDSDETRASLRRNGHTFLLRFKTPRPFDYDASDEDNNTGYATLSDSQAFSGIYTYIKARNIFSNGTYKCEIKAVKSLGLGEELTAAQLAQSTTTEEQQTAGNDN
jgi:hypothetical protein